MTDLAETPDEHTQEWSPSARGCQDDQPSLLDFSGGAA